MTARQHTGHLETAPSLTLGLRLQGGNFACQDIELLALHGTCTVTRTVVTSTERKHERNRESGSVQRSWSDQQSFLPVFLHFSEPIAGCNLHHLHRLQLRACQILGNQPNFWRCRGRRLMIAIFSVMSQLFNELSVAFDLATHRGNDCDARAPGWRCRQSRSRSRLCWT